MRAKTCKARAITQLVNGTLTLKKGGNIEDHESHAPDQEEVRDITHHCGTNMPAPL